MKNNKGFSLVELIVVIAIMAILATVAVIGVSVYIPKAQKAADEQLAADVEKALLFAHNTNSLVPGSVVIIYYGDKADDQLSVEVKYVGGDASVDTAEAEAMIEAALSDAFGDEYVDLRLKYDGWDTELGVISDGTAYENVQQSTFKGENLNLLLQDVQTVVDKVHGTLSNPDSGIGTPEEMKAYMAEKGIAHNDENTANSMVLWVAYELSDASNLEIELDQKEGTVEELLCQSWVDSQLVLNEDFDSESKQILKNAGIESTAPASAYTYARAEALAIYLDTYANTNFADGLRTTLEQAEEAAVSVDVSGLIERGFLDPLFTQMEQNDDLLEAYYGYYGFSPDDTNDRLPGECQAEKDAKAFMSYMKGIDNVSSSLIDKLDLSADNFYSDGKIADYVNSYLNVGNVLSSLNHDEGVFVFIYSGRGDDPIKCAPLDY